MGCSFGGKEPSEGRRERDYAGAEILQEDRLPLTSNTKAFLQATQFFYCRGRLICVHVENKMMTNKNTNVVNYTTL